MSERTFADVLLERFVTARDALIRVGSADITVRSAAQLEFEARGLIASQLDREELYRAAWILYVNSAAFKQIRTNFTRAIRFLIN